MAEDLFKREVIGIFLLVLMIAVAIKVNPLKPHGLLSWSFFIFVESAIGALLILDLVAINALIRLSKRWPITSQEQAILAFLGPGVKIVRDPHLDKEPIIIESQCIDTKDLQRKVVHFPTMRELKDIKLWHKVGVKLPDGDYAPVDPKDLDYANAN